MLKINILPVEEQKSIRQEQWRRVIVFFATGLSLVLVVGSVLLFPSFLPMLFEKRELENFLTVEQMNRKNLKIDEDLKQIADVKTLLSTVKGFAGSSPRALGILTEIFSTAGDSVAISQINIAKNGSFTITGIARGRRELLEFEENLKKSPRIQEINSPLSNIVRAAATFSMQGKFKTGKGL